MKISILLTTTINTQPQISWLKQHDSKGQTKDVSKYNIIMVK